MTEKHIDVIASGVQTIGVSVGTVLDGASLSLGWQNINSLKIMNPNSAVIIEWPTSDIFGLKIKSGTYQ